MRPARVLHAITMLELGGAQRNTLDTCTLLDRRRFEVGLACADRGELLPEAREIAHLRLYELPHLRREVRPWHDLRALFELRKVIRDFAPDLVHTHSSKAGILGRAAARAEGVPVIVHSVHGWGFGPHQSPPVHATFLAAERVAARWTTHFVAVSHENLTQGAELRLFAPQQASVIRSGIDLDRFRHPVGGLEVRAELGIPPAVPLVVQISCFKPQKAPERFVRLAAALAPRFPDAHFLLVGDGELRRQLEALRQELGLEGKLHLPGWRRDVSAVLDAATVVTLTSRFEGLPRVVVEALAARRPVVAMAVDGVQEVLHDGVNGFAVAPGDEAGLATRVAALLADPELRARLAAAAGDGLEAFSHTLMVRQQEALYARLLAAAGRELPPAQGGAA